MLVPPMRDCLETLDIVIERDIPVTSRNQVVLNPLPLVRHTPGCTRHHDFLRGNIWVGVHVLGLLFLRMQHQRVVIEKLVRAYRICPSLGENNYLHRFANTSLTSSAKASAAIAFRSSFEAVLTTALLVQYILPSKVNRISITS